MEVSHFVHSHVGRHTTLAVALAYTLTTFMPYSKQIKITVLPIKVNAKNFQLVRTDPTNLLPREFPSAEDFPRLI